MWGSGGGGGGGGVDGNEPMPTAATTAPVPVVFAKVLTEEESNQQAAEELQWAENQGGYSYQAWNDPNGRVHIRAQEPIDDPFSFWFTCLCMFFFILLIILLIWSFEVYGYDDDYY